MAIVQDGGLLEEESAEEFQRFFASPIFIHYVGMLNPPRPGVADCFQLLEHSYYKPGTARNELYTMRVFEWMDILWGIVSIPMEEKHFMERAAQVNHLRVANGVPTMLTGGEAFQFPIENERVFTLENTSGHPVYTGQGR